MGFSGSVALCWQKNHGDVRKRKIVFHGMELPIRKRAVRVWKRESNSFSGKYGV